MQAEKQKQEAIWVFSVWNLRYAALCAVLSVYGANFRAATRAGSAMRNPYSG